MLSRWKMMAGVLGISIGGLAAAASQCPKWDQSKGRQPEKALEKSDGKLPPAGPPSTTTPPPVLPTPDVVPALLLPAAPMPPAPSSPAMPIPTPVSEVPKAPAVNNALPSALQAPELPPAAPAKVIPTGAAVPPPAAPGGLDPFVKPTEPKSASKLVPDVPQKTSAPPAPAGDLLPPVPSGTTPPAPVELITPPPGKPVATPPVASGTDLPPQPASFAPAPPPPAEPMHDAPPAKPTAAVPATPAVAAATPFRIILRVGEGEPHFEVKNGDNLMLKVACSKVDIKSPEKGGPSEIIARGKVRFAGFGAEGTCDELKFFAGTGEVSMSGDVKVQVKDKLGRVESELTTSTMKYRIDASAVGGQIQP